MVRFVLISVLSVLALPVAQPAVAKVTPEATGSSTGGQAAASSGPSSSAMVVDITLERQEKDGTVTAMSAGHVFTAGDVIRLKLVSHYNGFLYVMSQGSSGKFSTVFPAMQTGSDNRVQRTQEYLVPALPGGWFVVEGPAGFDVLYFLLSPTPLTAPVLSNFTAPGPVSSLRPRCNDEIFRARGDCTDDSAGPAAVAPGQALPAPLAPLAGSASRDITFINKSNGTVGVTGESAAPMLYTFRLAHL